MNKFYCVMRTFLLISILVSFAFTAQSQFVCNSDSVKIYELAGTDLPATEGSAIFHSGAYKVIVGGMFADPEYPDEEGIYNCDMLIVDYSQQKTFILPLSFFPAGVADQFSAARFCYTSNQDTAYIVGGFGFDWAAGYETTLPLMTIFPLKTLIDSVVQHKDYFDLFEVVYDSRLAITEGKLVHAGNYFLVYNGKEVIPIEDEYTGSLTMNEWSYQKQLRKFSLRKSEGTREVCGFMVCSDPKILYQCIPEVWEEEPGLIEPVEFNPLYNQR